MKVIKAAEMGLCFGVRAALEMAFAQDEPSEITIHGELVHNEQVISDLARVGYSMTPESDRGGMPDTRRVLITAHGISHRERTRLQNGGKELVDTTCPLVTKVHDAALRWARPKPLPVCATAVHNAQRLVSDEVFRGNELAGRFASFR